MPKGTTPKFLLQSSMSKAWKSYNVWLAGRGQTALTFEQFKAKFQAKYEAVHTPAQVDEPVAAPTPAPAKVVALPTQQGDVFALLNAAAGKVEPQPEPESPRVASRITFKMLRILGAAVKQQGWTSEILAKNDVDGSFRYAINGVEITPAQASEIIGAYLATRKSRKAA